MCNRNRPPTSATIHEWQPEHPRWSELQSVARAVNQQRWFNSHFAWHLSNHLLVATQNEQIVGFLRLVTQLIGADEALPPSTLAGRPLREGKVLAFAVLPAYRRQGIGRTLQQAALERARQLDCHQLRSHSSGDNRANHQLKLALGFAVHRIEREDDRAGAYYLMPLQGLAPKRIIRKPARCNRHHTEDLPRFTTQPSTTKLRAQANQ